MLNSSIAYPYPILRDKAVDYKNSTFNADITVISLASGYEIQVEYKLNNNEVEKLIEQGFVKFALEIQCVSTWFRDLVISDGKTQKFNIESSKVHERVDLCPCIVACETIQDYASEDFAEEYEAIDFSINKGEVLAIGERKKFDALYKEDVIKKTDSIIQFNEKESAKTMYCEWEYPTIQIYLPKKQYDMYNEMGQNEPWKIPVLNAIFVVPVLVEAIMIIFKDAYEDGDNGLADYAWYKTLKYMVSKIANNDENKNRKLLSDPLGTAQILLNDNSREALTILSEVEKREA